MTGKRIDRAIKVDAAAELMGAHLGPSGPWNLPIIFTRDGDILTGELHIGCRADLTTIGRDQAEQMIRLSIKQAIQARMIAPSPEPTQ